MVASGVYAVPEQGHARLRRGEWVLTWAANMQVLRGPWSLPLSLTIPTHQQGRAQHLFTRADQRLFRSPTKSDPTTNKHTTNRRADPQLRPHSGARLSHARQPGPPVYKCHPPSHVIVDVAFSAPRDETWPMPRQPCTLRGTDGPTPLARPKGSQRPFVACCRRRGLAPEQAACATLWDCDTASPTWPG